MKLGKNFNVFTYVFFFFHGSFFVGNQLLIHYTSDALAANDTQFGLMIGAFYLGSVLMVLTLGEVSERIGKRFGGCLAAALYAIGAILISMSNNIPFAVFAYLIYGSGTGALEGIWFSLLGDYNGENTGKHMNLAQAVFSIGAVASPILITWLLQFASYRIMYLFIAAFMVAMTIILAVDRGIDDFAIKSTGDGSGLRMLKLMKTPLMLSLMLILLIGSGSETAIVYWLPNYLDTYGAAALGAFGLSAYWFASIPGRILASRLRNHGRSLIFSYLFCSIGMIIILAVPVPIFKIVGVLIAGIALAPTYPNISTMGGALFPTNSASAFSLMVFSSGIGGMVAQPIISSVSQVASITTVYSAIVVIMLALSFWSIFLSRGFSRRVKEADKTSSI